MPWGEEGRDAVVPLGWSLGAGSPRPVSSPFSQTGLAQSPGRKEPPLEGPCTPVLVPSSHPSPGSCSSPSPSWALPGAAPVCQGREHLVPLTPPGCLALDALGEAE